MFYVIVLIVHCLLFSLAPQIYYLFFQLCDCVSKVLYIIFVSESEFLLFFIFSKVDLLKKTELKSRGKPFLCQYTKLLSSTILFHLFNLSNVSLKGFPNTFFLCQDFFIALILIPIIISEKIFMIIIISFKTPSRMINNII